tara:strand:- start:3803 stop:4138 length:336 start_codon:yes stop_codon:yes gene_type:complete
MSYCPDRWVVVKISHPDDKSHYRVFGTWLGGYLDGDNWRLNSGIVRVEEREKEYRFFGTSGSVYSCLKNYYGTNYYTQGVLENIIKAQALIGTNVEILPPNTDFVTLGPET